MTITTQPRSGALARLRSLIGGRILFVLAGLGLLAGLVSAYISAEPVIAQPPAFVPAANPYARGIYANGIVESYQAHGTNISIFAEVPGPITQVFVSEGQRVRTGQPLLTIDDSVQRETTEQQKAQQQVAQAQITAAEANLKLVGDTYAKEQNALALDPQAITRDVLDTQHNALLVAQSNLSVARTQYQAASRAVAAAQALLGKYTIRAPQDGVVMSLGPMVGSYVSPQGAYDPYTQGYLPLIVMGSSPAQLEVRCYVDEILINRLPSAAHMAGVMYVRGTNVPVPLTFERMQPYVSPKIQLSNQRLEQVDVRVLPIIFSVKPPSHLDLYPGQLVDVYIGSK